MVQLIPRNTNIIYQIRWLVVLVGTKIEPDWWICSWYNLPIKFVHASKRDIVTDEVDEAIAGSSSSEFVLYDFDGDHVGFSHGLQGLQNKVLIHVILQAANPEGSFSAHFYII